MLGVFQMAKVLVFGDSIAYGVWDIEGGWVQRLRKFFDGKTLSDSDFQHRVYNLSVSGDTTWDLLERFEFETRRRMKEDEELVIIFAIGVNDSYYVHSRGNFRTSVKQFKKNLQKLIELAKRFSPKIIFLGLMPVDESKVDPMPWDKDKSYKGKRVTEFDNVVKSVCKDNKVFFVDILNGIGNDYKMFLEDGVHPNSEGHEKMFEIVKGFLQKSSII